MRRILGSFLLMIMISTIVNAQIIPGGSSDTAIDNATKIIKEELTAADKEIMDLEKTEITCDGALEVDYERNVATFNENVLIKDPQVMIKADKMQVFFDVKSKAIDRIVAEGSVKFKKGDRQAKSDMAVYLAKEGKIILTGNPMVKRGMDILTGEKITFFKNDSRMICEPSAKLIIFSGDRSEKEGEWW